MEYLVVGLSALAATALGGPWAGIASVGVMTAAVLFGSRRLHHELTALDLLAASVEEGEDLHVDAPGEAGRIARAVEAALAERNREQALREATAQRLEGILEAAPSGLAVLDADGRVEHMNDELRDMMGLQLDPTGAMPVEVLRAVEILEVIDEVKRGEEATPRDLALQERDLSVSAHAFAEGTLVVVQDVSRERRAGRARTDFVANVSHELRTPIAAILGYAEALVDGLDEAANPDDLRMAQKVLRNGVRLQTLFEDLLALYRIEARRRELPREDVMLSMVLAEAVVTAVDEASGKGISFEVDCPDDLMAHANPQSLSAIIGNLAANACKYTPEGGSVRVVAVDEGDEGVRIDVIDTGVGIPKEHHDRVFERFYRVDDGRAREVGGTGLGLAIVKHLAQASGAELSLESDTGEGTTMRVHLPPPADSSLRRTWDATLPTG